MCRSLGLVDHRERGVRSAVWPVPSIGRAGPLRSQPLSPRSSQNTWWCHMRWCQPGLRWLVCVGMLAGLPLAGRAGDGSAIAQAVAGRSEGRDEAPGATVTAAAAATDPATANPNDVAAPPLPERIYIPAQELEQLLAKDPQGVLLPIEEFEALWKQAHAQPVPAGIVGLAFTSCEYRLRTVGDRLLIFVTAQLTHDQPGWQVLSFPLDRLQVERVTLNGQAAPMARQPDGRFALFSSAAGQHVVEWELSADLTAVGSDQVAAFSLLPSAVARFSMEIPQNKKLLVDGLQAPLQVVAGQPDRAVIDLGGRAEVQLRLTDRAADRTSDVLTFASTGYGVHVTPGEATWHALTDLQVYGRPIDRLTLSVPGSLEISDVEASGLDRWELMTDPANPQRTQILLWFRQPFTGSRRLTVRGVVSPPLNEAWVVPPLTIEQVTSHLGQLLLQVPWGVRAKVLSSEGLRRSTEEVPMGAEASAAPAGPWEQLRFDVWREDFELRVLTQPRPAEISAAVAPLWLFSDREVRLATAVTVTARFAPLFELDLAAPVEWSIRSAAVSINGAAAVPMTWEPLPVPAGEQRVRLFFPQALAPGMVAVVQLDWSTERVDWPPEQKPIEFVWPEIQVLGASLQETTFVVEAAADLELAPQEVSGLEPVALQAGSERLRFVSSDTRYAGRLTITRKPARLSSDGLSFFRLDQQTCHAAWEQRVTVSGGSIRSLDVGLPESVGSAVRFHVYGATLIEQQPLGVVEGVQRWRLQFADRVTGTIALWAQTQQPRQPGPWAAPLLQLSAVDRETGILAIEGGPDQQLTMTAVNGLGERLAEVDLLDLPASISYAPRERLVGLFRTVGNGSRLTLSDERFASAPIPTAVCQQLSMTSVISESGTTQHQAQFRVLLAGVPGLQVVIPEGSELWSVVWDGKPLEVRASPQGLLLPIPPSEETAHVLDVFFKTAGGSRPHMTRWQSSTPKLLASMSDGTTPEVPIIEQTWKVHVPEQRLLVASHGPLEAAQPFDPASGFLRTLSQWPWPSWRHTGRTVLGLLAVGVLCWGLVLGLCRHGVRGVVAVAAILCVLITMGTGWLLVMGTRYEGLGPKTAAVDSEFALGLQVAQEARSSGVVPARRGSAVAAAKAMTPAKPVQTVDEVDESLAFRSRVHLDAVEAEAAAPADETNGRQLSLDRAKSQSMLMDTPALGVIEQEESLAQTAPSPAPGDAFGADQLGSLELKAGAVDAKAEPAPPQADVLRFGFDEAQQKADAANDGVALAEQQERGAEPADKRQRGRSAGLPQGLLSLAIGLEIPERTREFVFRYLGTEPTAGQLDLTFLPKQSNRDVALFGFFLGLILGWLQRHQKWSARMKLILLAGLLGAGVLPLAGPGWQVWLDGLGAAVLGAVLAWTIAASGDSIERTVSWIQRWWWGAACVAMTVLMPVSALHADDTAPPTVSAPDAPGAATVTGPQSAEPFTNQPAAGQTPLVPAMEAPVLPPWMMVPWSPRPEAAPGGLKWGSRVWVPYTDLSQLDAARQVFLPDSQFRELWKRAHPEELLPEPSPVPAGVVEALYAARLLPPEREGASAFVEVHGRFVVSQPSTTAVPIPLPITSSAIVSATLQDEPAVLDIQDGRPVLQATPPGLHVLDVVYRQPAVLAGDGGTLVLEFAATPAARLSFELPSPQLLVRVNGSSTPFRIITRENNLQAMEMAIDRGGRFEITWQPNQQRMGVASTVQVDSESVFTVGSTGIEGQASFRFRVRQGQLGDASFELPAEFRLKAVAGEDVGGWELLEGAAVRKLRVFFRRTITDNTLLTISGYLAHRVEVVPSAVSIPQISPLELTSEVGTVQVYSEADLSVRPVATEQLQRIDASAVSPLTNAAPRPGVLQFSYRFVQRPWSLSLETQRQTSKVSVQGWHAIQLTPTKLRTSSRFLADLQTTPQSSVVLRVPTGALVLDVQSPFLKDWYLAQEGEQTLLTVEFQQPRLGTVEVVMQSTGPRPEALSSLSIDVPEWLRAQSAVQQLALWLDGGLQVASVQPGPWKPVDIATLETQLRSLRTDSPALSLSTSRLPFDRIQLSVQTAQPRLKAAALTTVYVTDAATLYGFLWKWNISQAATDHLLVQTPAWLAGRLDLSHPSVREVTSEPLSNGQILWHIRLRSPMMGPIMLMPTAAFPLTAAAIETPTSVFLAAHKDAPQRLDVQQSYFLLVNLSQRQLIPQAAETWEPTAVADWPFVVRDALLRQATEFGQLLSPDAAPKWSSTQLPRAAQAAAAVNLAELQSAVALDGSYRTQAVYTLKNRGRQFLALRLPTNTVVQTIVVAGQPARAVQSTVAGEPALLIPLPKTSVADSSFQVQLVFAGKLPRPLPQRGQFQSQDIALPAPALIDSTADSSLGIPVARTRWTVSLPKEISARPLTNVDRHNLSTLSSDDAGDDDVAQVLLQDFRDVLDGYRSVSKPSSRPELWSKLKLLEQAVTNRTSQLKSESLLRQQQELRLRYRSLVEQEQTNQNDVLDNTVQYFDANSQWDWAIRGNGGLITDNSVSMPSSMSNLDGVVVPNHQLTEPNQSFDFAAPQFNQSQLSEDRRMLADTQNAPEMSNSLAKRSYYQSLNDAAVTKLRSQLGDVTALGRKPMSAEGQPASPQLWSDRAGQQSMAGMPGIQPAPGQSPAGGVPLAAGMFPPGAGGMPPAGPGFTPATGMPGNGAAGFGGMMGGGDALGRHLSPADLQEKTVEDIEQLRRDINGNQRSDAEQPFAGELVREQPLARADEFFADRFELGVLAGKQAQGAGGRRSNQWVMRGGLSMPFRIPQGAQQLHFGKSGGDPVLGLQLRHESAANTWWSWGWCGVCLLFAIALLRLRSDNNTKQRWTQIVFWVLLAAGATLALLGHAGWVWLGFVLFVMGAVLFAIQFQQSAEE
jgi:hypothetical protein